MDGPDGLALLTFFDGSETQVQGDTRITVEVPAGAPLGAGVSIFQSAGTTINHVRQLSPGASFQTDTPSAVAMVRGTTYVVTVVPQPETMADETESTPIDVDELPGPLAATAADSLSAAAITNSCRHDSPADCVTSVVLLGDIDGHVGHVEVASHIVGHPALHLITHGDSVHISRAGAVRQLIPAAHLTQLHEATQHLQDVQLASRAHVIARRVVRAGLHPRPAPPKPHG